MDGIDNKRLTEIDPAWGEAAARVAASSGLSRSPRLRKLFSYLCERTWAGTADELHEHTIGEDVFGRPIGYDTASENIVRVSVSQLRKRLDQYFAGQGVAERLVITIPKGRYAVEFLPREVTPPAATPHRAVEGSPQPQAGGKPHVGRSVLIAGLIIAAVVAGSLLAGWKWFAPAVRLTPHERFWSAAFTPAQDVYIVVADSGFGLLQDITGQSLTFENYLNGTRPSAQPPNGAALPAEELVRRLVNRQYTSVSDASIAFQLGRLSHSFQGRAAVRSARSIDIRDLKAHNIILLGSARSNPWVGLLKEKLNFFLDYEEQPPRGFVLNHKPIAGEPAVYRATARSGEPGDAYGLVSWIPNLDATGSIVTLSGTNMEGTEAAAELLLNAAAFEKLRARLQAPPSGPFPYFETVVRASSRAGAGSGPEIVAFRKITAK